MSAMLRSRSDSAAQHDDDMCQEATSDSAFPSVNVWLSPIRCVEISFCLVTAHCSLDFVGKPVEVLVNTIEYFALCYVRGQVADQRGLRGILAKLFDGCSIILHDARYFGG
jgi:hypothetical protein